MHNNAAKGESQANTWVKKFKELGSMLLIKVD
jgi:hypothetical protein